MKKTAALFCLIFLSLVSFKQETEKWTVATNEEFVASYQKAIDWFAKTTNYKVNVTYSTFTSHTATKPYESSEGFYIRNNKNMHSFALGMHNIQNEQLAMSVDTANKMIVLKAKSDFAKAPIDNESFSGVLKNAKSIQKKIATTGEIIFRLEFKASSMFDAYEYSVDQKGLLTSVKFYYSKEMKDDEDDDNSIKGKPRAEIVFSGYQTGLDFNYEKEFSEKKYLKVSGTSYKLSDGYSDYELSDYRNLAKQ